MDRIFSIFIIISLFVYNSTFELTEDKIKVLNEMIQSQMKSARLNTVGFIITNKTSTIFQNVYTEKDKASNTTPFILGSVSKSFTALGILKLNINLNQTLDKFDLKEYIDENDAKDITISELLNHTSGLDRDRSKIIYEKGYYSYSNYGYGLLGKIIEKQSGEKFEEYMKNKIFGPLKMVNTNAKYNSDIIDSYDNFFGFKTKYTSLESEIGDGFAIPQGFISASIEDMGNYLRYYLDDSSEDYKNYISQMIQGNINLQYNKYYGMGLDIEKKNNQTIYHHDGLTNSFQSSLYIFPDIEIGIFIITNTIDMLCRKPTIDFMNNIINFITLDTYEEVDTIVFFVFHFFFDIIFFILIGIPITYLIVTIVRKFKKTEYMWFNGVKGKIIFAVDILALIIIPIFIIVFFYTFNWMLIYAAKNLKDIQFVLFTILSVSIFNFLIKLIYVFIYNKYFKIARKKKVENIDLDYIGMEDEKQDDD